MDTMTFCVPCLFGLEGLVGDELRRLDLQNVRVEDRRVFFEGDFAAMAKANLCCRMGECDPSCGIVHSGGSLLSFS